MAKPFVKWAGGKGKLLNQLEAHLPEDFDLQQAITYIEPFVGGGAMLFHMLEAHPNIKRAIINDINPALIQCYEQIKTEPETLIEELKRLEAMYYENESQDQRKSYFYIIRDNYNELNRNTEKLDGLDLLRANIEKAACFIFLNRTCFNGLYRENRSGEFNVPFGRYANPTICDEQKILAASKELKKVEILCGDYHEVIKKLRPGEKAFFYFDPPYRPLLGVNSFKDYTRFEFGDEQQEELHKFCNLINDKGYQFMLSNSDSEIVPGVNYFEQLFQAYKFHRVMAPRVINAFAAKRVPQSEVLITNYRERENAK